MGIQEIRQLKKDYEAKVRTEGQEALKAEFKAFFETHPDVEAIRWSQYTPYFCDGDPCHFSVYDFTVRTVGCKGDEGDYEDGYEYASTYAEEPSRIAVAEFERTVSDNDIFEAVFGDHVQVTATREGFLVEEYEHD